MPRAVVANKDNDSGSFAKAIADLNAEVVVPSRSNTKQPRLIDEKLFYKDRKDRALL